MSSFNHSFSVEHAEKYGVECAIMIHHLQYWIEFNRSNRKNFRENRTWMYQSHSEIVSIYSYWSKDQVHRILKKLEDLEIIIKGNFNENKYDKTLWIAFKDEKMFTISRNRDMPEEIDEAESQPRYRDFATSNKDTIPNAGKKQQTQAAAVFSCLKEVDIPQSDKEWLTANHTEPEVQHAIEYSKTQVIKNCLAATLKWAAKNKPQITVPKEQQTEQNRRYAKELLGEGKESERGYEAVPLQKYVEIIYKRGNMQAICIEYHIANFIETLTGKLRDFSII